MQDNLEILNRIFSVLSTISTKGEDTISMADCLRAFQQVLQNMAEERKGAESNAESKVED